MNDHRLEKINDELKRELARLIAALKDPRVQGVISLTRVETAGDLRHAKVYVSVLGDTAGAVLAGLRSAGGFLRRELGACLTLRTIPELHFIRDDSLARGAHILQILRETEEGNDA